MSRASFHNSSIALQNRLTSYDFNSGGIALQALDFILRPEKGKKQAGPQIREVVGMIFGRETVARISAMPPD